MASQQIKKYTYDVFLSHNSEDKPAVETLAARLEDEEGLRPFLDKWHLIPGEPWQEELEKAINESATCAVFLGPSGLGSWENEEMRDALDQRVRNKSFRVLPVLLPEADPKDDITLPRFLRRLVWVDFRNGLDDNEAFRRLIAGIQGEPPGRILPYTTANGSKESKNTVVISGEGKRYACLIGTNEYENESAFPSIAYPETNIEALTHLLEDRRIGDFDQVVTLKSKEKYTDIIREIKRLTGQLKRDDLLLIYFAGYAVLDEELTGNIHLITKETDPELLSSSAIPLPSVKTFIAKSAAIQKILILDCQYRNNPAALKGQLTSNAEGIYLISNSPEFDDGFVPARKIPSVP